MKFKLSFLILIMLLAVYVPSTLSYFFTYTKAEGTVTVELFDDSTMEECVHNTIKEISVTADEESDPIFVRVKTFAPSDVMVDSETAGWNRKDDGYWYYGAPIAGTSSDYKQLFASNADINFDVALPSTEENDFEEGDNRHVVVIYEATPALYAASADELPEDISVNDCFQDSNGGLWYANWGMVLEPETVEVEGA